MNQITTGTIPSLIQLEKISLDENSTLADLPVYDFCVDSHIIVESVEKHFRTHATLPGVIISQNDAVVGVLSRRKFFEQLGQRYGVSVYLKRPMHLLLKNIIQPPLILAHDTTIHFALYHVLNRTPQFVYEPIAVKFHNAIHRLLDVYTLLMAQSRLFANLQAALQTTNAELEVRVAERTTELVQTNEELTIEVNRRKQTEDALIIARDEALTASKFKSQLLANVSHELRTPLGGILGHAEMLQIGHHGELTDSQKEATTRIIRSTQYLDNLVNQLLDQARIEAGEFVLDIRPFSPMAIAKETAVSAQTGKTAQDKGLTIITLIDPKVPPKVTGDPVRVTQILVNLIGNAIKFTPTGGITIRLFSPQADQWAIQVTDTGSGIPLEAQEYIFEPFRQVDSSLTRRNSGTGLGLSIVKQLVEAMDGTIQLQSIVGGGSTFTVTFPIHVTVKEKP